MSLSVDKVLRKAQSHIRAGELDDAEELYKQILRKFPKNTKAIQGYQKLKAGITAKGSLDNEPQQAHLDELIDLYNQGHFVLVLSKSQLLIDLFSKNTSVYSIQGAANMALQKYDAAINSYKQALKLKPDYANAYYNMGIALTGKGDLDTAIYSYKQAIRINPNHAYAFNNLGLALNGKGDQDAAIDNYKEALKLKPDYAEVFINMGASLNDKGDLAAGIESYKKALKIKPDYAEAYYNMGNSLNDKGDLVASIESYEKALEINPDYAEAYLNIGNVHKDQDRLVMAIESYKKALKINPDYAEAYYNMGNLHKDQDRLDVAIENYEHALKIRPDYQIACAEKICQQAYICDWKGTGKDTEEISIPELGTSTQEISPYGLLAVEDAPDRHRLRSELWAKNRSTKKLLSLSLKQSDKNKRLRIGYFSSDFRQHPVSYLLTKILELHDRNDFQVFAYSFGPGKNSQIQKRIVSAVDVYHDVRKMNSRDIALLAHKDKIDIAVDLNGYTENNRVGIFACRPAPIQINYLGYPSTMGADFIDYIIADEMIIPKSQQKNYSENIINLPNCYMPQDNTREISNKAFFRKDFGLPQNSFVFCCFNNSFKITPKEFDIWMRLLDNVEDSVLWLLNSNKWCKENLKIEATSRGIESNRLIFADRLPLDEHLARHQLADLFLDTFNFNAHTTASDALWAGLPVVTKLGKSFCARVAGSLLNSLELNELITSSEEEYENLAMTLASNKLKLTNIRKKLAEKRLIAPLFDSETYTRNLEKAYSHAYERHIDGLAPAGFKV